VSKLESDLGFAAPDSTEVRAELVAHAAVRWGRPEMILNRRRDVREGEIAPAQPYRVVFALS